jgi:hypothetical protein
MCNRSGSPVGLRESRGRGDGNEDLVTVVASIILAVTWMLILSRKLGVTVQDAGESGGDLARLQRLGEQLADTRDERLPSQGRAAITAHQHDR